MQTRPLLGNRFVTRNNAIVKNALVLVVAICDLKVTNTKMGEQLST
jgi:hypothetical protein